MVRGGLMKSGSRGNGRLERVLADDEVAAAVANGVGAIAVAAGGGGGSYGAKFAGVTCRRHHPARMILSRYQPIASPLRFLMEIFSFSDVPLVSFSNRTSQSVFVESSVCPACVSSRFPFIPFPRRATNSPPRRPSILPRQHAMRSPACSLDRSVSLFLGFSSTRDPRAR